MASLIPQTSYLSTAEHLYKNWILIVNTANAFTTYAKSTKQKKTIRLRNCNYLLLVTI